MPKKHTTKNTKQSNTIPGTKTDLSKPPAMSARKQKVVNVIGGTLGAILLTTIIIYVLAYKSVLLTMILRLFFA